MIAFGVGEPDFDTPEHIKEAARRALDRGVGKYTPVAGTLDLRAAAAEDLNRAHGTRLSPENVIVSVGAKHSLYNLFMAMLDEGDEVIIPTPCWVSHPEIVGMAGGRPVLLPTRPETGYRLEEAALRRLVGPRTRAILLNSPCNPTGAVYDEDATAVVARVAAEHRDLVVITDDIYRRLVYGARWVSLPRLAPEIADRVILIDGVSKTYAMTGWRIGFCAGPRPLIEAMTTIQGQSTTNPTAIAQAAALAAITGPQDVVESMRQEFDRRRRVMIDRLRAIPGLALVHEPEGAFYCFPDLRAFIGRSPAGGAPIGDDLALANHILDRGRVALVPGSGFLAPGFARLSYAASLDVVEEGCRRLGAALAELG